MLSSLPVPCLNRCDRAELLAYFENAWDIEDCLFSTLRSDGAFYVSPDPLRNRLIFYLGHSAVFYINKLIRVGWLNQRIEPHYEMLFEIGVDPSTPEELEAAMQHVQWPQVDRVWNYRHNAREEIARTIRNAPLEEGGDRPLQNRPLWALMMGIEHQRIHFETSSMLLRQLDAHHLHRPDRWQYAPTAGETPVNTLVSVGGARAVLGKPLTSGTYGWDSDYGAREVDVKPFRVGKTPVTNGEFLQFVRDGGYENPEFWGTRKPDAPHPKFWRREGDRIRYRTVFEEIDLPLTWPVEINYDEAIAYCRWYGEGTRLMCEAEWQVAAGDRAVDSVNLDDNLDLRFGSPSPVGLAESDELCDLRGNVWEWLGDDFAGLPSFEPHPLYADYSEPFFDGQHKVMRGGSWASTGAYASSRNWFRPHFYQHAGFRIARDI